MLSVDTVDDFLTIETNVPGLLTSSTRYMALTIAFVRTSDRIFDTFVELHEFNSMYRILHQNFAEDVYNNVNDTRWEQIIRPID